MWSCARSALACAGLAAWAVVVWGERPAPWLLAGCILYLVGAIAVTIAANVPLNDALAATRPDGTGAADRWRSYRNSWTEWNHLRASAALAAPGLRNPAAWSEAALARRGRAVNASEPAAAGAVQAYLQLRTAGERPDGEAVARPHALGRR